MRRSRLTLLFLLCFYIRNDYYCYVDSICWPDPRTGLYLCAEIEALLTPPVIQSHHG